MWTSWRDKAELYSIIVAESFQVQLTSLAEAILLEAIELETRAIELFRVITIKATRAATTRSKPLKRENESIS